MYCFHKTYGRTSPHAKFGDPKIEGSGLKKLVKSEKSQTDPRQTDRKERKYRKTRKKI